MNLKISGRTIELVQGDITEQAVDAIVNAANSRLAGGGGVDGAIHRAGGPSIMEETGRRYPDGCPTGQAVITAAGDLSADHVIHAVGPFYRDGDRGEAELLASAYRESLARAEEAGLTSVAFPSLSTGAYRYPLKEAAGIALRTTAEYLKTSKSVTQVRFVLFDKSAYDAFAAALEELDE